MTKKFIDEEEFYSAQRRQRLNSTFLASFVVSMCVLLMLIFVSVSFDGSSCRDPGQLSTQGDE